MIYSENLATSSPCNPVRIRTVNAKDKSSILKADYSIKYALRSKKYQKRSYVVFYFASLWLAKRSSRSEQWE